MSDPTPQPTQGDQGKFTAPPQKIQMTGDDILRATRPKHMGDGLGTGLGVMAGGIVAGVAGLVVGPVQGAKKGGIAGAAEGLVAGVLGVVVLPVAGIAGGVVQIGRGVVNTPEAIAGKYQGKVWNPDSAEWEVPPELPTAAIQVYKGKPGGGGGGGGAHDTQAQDLYAVLGVDKTASPEEIKKKYYLLARRYHPDKNKDSDDATEIFQAIGKAFQILGNPETRAKYDRGELDSTGAEVMDAGVLFGMLFGSDKFDSLVGELMAVTMAKHGDKPPPKSELRKVQEERVIRLAGNLAAVLDAYESKAPDAFTNARKEQAKLLASEAFGEILLAIIGEIYIREAGKHQGNFLRAGMLEWEGKKAKISSEMASVKQAFAMAKHAQKVGELSKELEKKVADNPDNDDVVLETLQAKEAIEKESVLLMLQFMWAVNDVDIRQTLKNVVAMVLKEPKGVANASEISKNRAGALLEMGKIFSEASAPDEVHNKAQQFQDALKRMDELQRGARPE